MGPKISNDQAQSARIFFAPGTLQHLVLSGLSTSAKMAEHSSYELLIVHMRWTVEASKKIKTQQNNTNPPTYP